MKWQLSQISKIQPIKTQNQFKPFGEPIGTCITCHELHFQGDSSNGADLTKKYVSKDLFLRGSSYFNCGIGFQRPFS